jgi:hypothetical protein
MPISINWATKVITVPVTFMTLISGTPGTGDMQPDPALYELDVNALRLALKDIEDSEGMPYLDTHRHNSEVTISGVTYARTFEVINGYTVDFDVSVYDHYSVRCVGANHNIADVRRPSTVSLIIGNSAGLITVSSGSGLSPTQAAMLEEIWKLHGLAAGTPLVVTPTTRTAGGISQTITEVGGDTTVERV